MLLKYFYNDKLAHASYVVGCQATGEAIVVDPGRDVEPYLRLAKAEGMQISGVTETHIHADFLSGARELAARTGATLYLSDEGGPGWAYLYAKDYAHQALKDGSVFYAGNIRFDVLHTPGHTPEHISFLVTDGGARAPSPVALLSGDFVFVGDVGRPDLLERAAGVQGSSEQMARLMFVSLKKFRSLPDLIQVLPAHGAGSACGKALGAVPSSTVGYEKLVNWALAEMDEERFVTELIAGQPEAPRYFAMMKKLNKEGPPLLERIPAPARAPQSAQTLASWIEQGQVVDVRSAPEFAQGHVRGSINIPHNKSFVTWAGWLLDYDRPIYLLCTEEERALVIRDLQSIGLDFVKGTMDPAVLSDLKQAGELQTYTEVSVEDASAMLEQGSVHLVDVRNDSEWEEGHIDGAQHIMLGHLAERVTELPTDRPILVQCRSGARSAIAASILQAHGVKDVRNLLGGYDAWVSAHKHPQRV